MKRSFPSKKRKKARVSHAVEDEEIEKKSQEAWDKIASNPHMTVQQAVGIPDKTLEEIYSLAHSYYNQDRYKEALALFELLAGSAPNKYHYVLGLGATYREMNKLDQALGTFVVAFQLQKDNPIPPYYIMEILLTLQKEEEALQYAELTARLCDGKPEYATYQERCKLIASSLQESSKQEVTNK